MINEAKVRECVQARKQAAELIDMAQSFVADFKSDEAKTALWVTLRTACLREAPLPAEDKDKPAFLPMSNAEADEFDNERIPFGKYKDWTVAETMQEDADYLQWLSGQDDRYHKFRVDLDRYLANEDVAKELENE